MTPSIDKIIEHYNHAREKHPEFVVRLSVSTPNIMKHLATTIATEEKILSDKNHRPHASLLLYHKYDKLWYNYFTGNITAAIEEAYDAIAVILRTIDVLEGRQALGKPEEVKQ